MRKNKIYAFNSHYKVYDYSLGDNLNLERALTYHDYKSFKDYPKYLYDSVNRILYIPRGYDQFQLEEWNGKPVTVVDNEIKEESIGFQMKKPPRDETEERIIRFMIGSEEFQSTKFDTQKVIIAPPGFGKTYCAIAAIQRLHVRTVIIMHTQNLKEQWIQKIKEYTSLGGPNVVDWDASKTLHDYLKHPPSKNQKIFITTRSLLESYCNIYGMDSLNDVFSVLGIGLKIYDEAHKEYARTLFIDYVTNVRKTFYLTATFQLSNVGENYVFQRSFNLVNKLRIKPDENKRHIIYFPVLFNSHPNPITIHRVSEKKHGFDRYAYIDYELEAGILEKEIRYMVNFFLVEKRMPGKTLLLSSKKSTCDYFEGVLKEETNGLQKCCSFYTGNKVDNYKSYDCICATAQMLGTGEDIPGLRFMHNTEPSSSLPNTDQFSGRLRPYEGGKKFTVYVEYIDIGFPKIYEWYQKRKKLLDHKVKECHEIMHVGY